MPIRGPLVYRWQSVPRQQPELVINRTPLPVDAPSPSPFIPFIWPTAPILAVRQQPEQVASRAILEVAAPAQPPFVPVMWPDVARQARIQPDQVASRALLEPPAQAAPFKPYDWPMPAFVQDLRYQSFETRLFLPEPVKPPVTLAPANPVLRRRVQTEQATNILPLVLGAAPAITGTLSRTLDALTLVALGTVSVDGTLARTLAPLVLQASGYLSSEGVFDETLAPLLLTGQGVVGTPAAVFARFRQHRMFYNLHNNPSH